MGDSKSKTNETKLKVPSGHVPHNLSGSKPQRSPQRSPVQNRRFLLRAALSCPGPSTQNGAVVTELTSQGRPSPNINTLSISRVQNGKDNFVKRHRRNLSAATRIAVETDRSSIDSRQNASDAGESLELPRIRNYQIKSVKKGIPNIDPNDGRIKKIKLSEKELRISPYWICQKRKEGAKMNATAWGFSTFVTFVCVVLPLTSFSSDVAFYVTCSDHYNHTASILDKVRQHHNSERGAKADFIFSTIAESIDRNRRKPMKSDSYRKSSDLKPAPLLSRGKRSNLSNTYKTKLLTKFASIALNQRFKTLRERNILLKQKVFKRNVPQTYETYSQQPELVTVRSRKNEHAHAPRDVNHPLRVTNFEVEEYEYSQTNACDTPLKVRNYMLTDKASEELEAHRHVTIDIFEPVFILGSFPSLILCILTRLVVLVTGHKNFLSAYVINIACMPLQLVTGALSVHSASYHLGTKGFECWHCALENDCSGMGPLWWLHDGVTKSLLVSILTKILDGVGGGLVLFIVIIRLLWSKRGHVTFWWSLLRGLCIVAAFFFCVFISPLLVITPAMSVMRLEFMELATPFPGREKILLSLTIMMGFGLAAWGLSFAVLFIYVIYSMCMYCRERTLDR